jgi:hypothetical protein
MSCAGGRMLCQRFLGCDSIQQSTISNICIRQWKDRINSHLESELQGFRQESGLWRVGEQQRIEEFFRSMVIEAADLKQSSNAFVMKLERNWEENLVASLSREFS